MIRHFVFPDCFAQCMSVDIPEASAYIADMLKQKNTEQVRTTAMPILSAAVAEPSKPKKPMKMYVGITDYDCYTRLKANKCDEVSFWTPGTTNFRALEENDMFLFKLHSPRDYIVGGGFFVRFSMLPTYLAWRRPGRPPFWNGVPISARSHAPHNPARKRCCKSDRFDRFLSKWHLHFKNA